MPLPLEKRIRHPKAVGRDTNFWRQILRGFLQVTLSVFVFAAVWYVTRLSAFTITDIAIVGGETISHDMVRAAVDQELSGKYMLIVPKRFSVFYPHDEIRAAVEKIPRVHEVTVTRTSRTALAVSFKEYVPHALWCTEATATPCIFIDDTGYAFAEAPSLQGSTLIRHIIAGAAEITPGQVMTPGESAAIDTFAARLLSEAELRVSSLLHTKEGDLIFFVNGGGAIKTAGYADLPRALENVLTVLRSAEFKHLAPGNFQYIDVRFDNKVFVNEEPESSASAEEE